MRREPLILAAWLALGSSIAEGAEPVPSLDLRSFHPPMDPNGLVYLEPVATPGAGSWNVGAYASYALSPVVLTDGRDDELGKAVAHQASLDYFANMGIGSRFSAGLMVPTVVYQTGDDVRPLLPGSDELPHTALGDLSLGVKATLLTPSDMGGLGLSLLGRAHLPTGDSRSYASDGSFRGEGRVLGELNLLAIALRATAGFRARAAEQRFPDDGSDASRFGNDIPFGLGLTVRPQVFGIDREGRFRWSLEVHGAMATTPEIAAAPQSPVLAALSARYTVDEVSALFAVEAPLDDAAGNPVVRPIVAIGWAPRFEDADSDEIEDEADECPELAEDRDGFQDHDGCPDFDNDDDGVPDDSDKCPKGQEDLDEFQDDDGCPDPDNDGDGVLDAEDACPSEPGPASGGAKPGCADPDPDRDGVPREKDTCPGEPEDEDGFQDGDGCPDPDNDGDGVLDAEDACGDEKGEHHASPELRGCVILDHDGDTFDDSADRCASEPEDFDGVDDDDGCPDEKAGPPLVTVTEKDGETLLSWARPPRIVGDEIDPKSMPTLRALARLLNAHPTWIAAIGARPEGKSAGAAQAALNRAFAATLTLRWLTHRDASAEAVGWAAVQDLPGSAAGGLGVLLLAPREKPAAP